MKIVFWHQTVHYSYTVYPLCSSVTFKIFTKYGKLFFRYSFVNLCTLLSMFQICKYNYIFSIINYFFLYWVSITEFTNERIWSYCQICFIFLFPLHKIPLCNNKELTGNWYVLAIRTRETAHFFRLGNIVGVAPSTQGS